MYQALIDAHIRERNDARQAERGSDVGEWHPSGLSDCPRKAVYEYTGTEPTDDKDFRNIRIMDRGTEMHAIIQNLLVTEYPKALLEVKVDALGIKGSCDALLPFADGVKDIGDQLEPTYELQEFKSESPNAKYRRKGKPSPSHVKQARIYYMCLKEQGYLLDGIRIVYLDRDSWTVEEYEVEPWTIDEEDAFLEELAELEAHAMDGTLPPRMPPEVKKGKTKRYWLCGFCPFQTRCYEQDGVNTRGD